MHNRLHNNSINNTRNKKNRIWNTINNSIRNSTWVVSDECVQFIAYGIWQTGWSVNNASCTGAAHFDDIKWKWNKISKSDAKSSITAIALDNITILSMRIEQFSRNNGQGFTTSLIETRWRYLGWKNSFTIMNHRRLCVWKSKIWTKQPIYQVESWLLSWKHILAAVKTDVKGGLLN